MDEIRYLISDASKKVDVETHVLRYWEEELGISVPRNGMGHRYYTDFHIRLFCQVKKLKEKGYQLKAIKYALQQVMEKNQGIIDAAEILETDLSQTLRDNPISPFFGRNSVNANLMKNTTLPSTISSKSENENSLSGGMERLSDYSCLEPVESDSGKLIFHHGKNEENGEIEIVDSKAWIFINKKDENCECLADESGSLTECDYFAPNHQVTADKRQTENQNHTAKTATVEHITCKGKIQEEQRIKEKDGQVEMKNKRKDRKKPSAWERRNGMVGSSHISAGQLRNQMNGKITGGNDWEEEGYLLEGIAERMPERTKERIQGAMYGSSTMEEFERNLAFERSFARQAGEDAGEDEELENADEEEANTENRAEHSFSEESETNHSENTEKNKPIVSAECSMMPEKKQEAGALPLSQDEKMMKFQEIMNHIIRQALEANNEKLSQDISTLVNQKVIDELEDLMRIRDEREEERFRQIDEIIRSCQRDNQGKAEAAAAKMPFFKKKWLSRDNKHLQSF